MINQHLSHRLTLRLTHLNCFTEARNCSHVRLRQSVSSSCCGTATGKGQIQGLGGQDLGPSPVKHSSPTAVIRNTVKKRWFRGIMKVWDQTMRDSIFLGVAFFQRFCVRKGHFQDTSSLLFNHPCLGLLILDKYSF